LKAQVHLMQPQGLPAVGRVHTATEPGPQTGFGCLPAHGPGGQSLAAAGSIPNRTAAASVRATPTVVMKHLMQLSQRIASALPCGRARFLPRGARLVLGRNEQTFVQKRSGNAFEPWTGRGKVRRITEEAAPCDGSSWIEETERSQGENKTAPTKSDLPGSVLETVLRKLLHRHCFGLGRLAGLCGEDMDRIDRPPS
jgi:hypothetical protein